MDKKILLLLIIFMPAYIFAQGFQNFGAKMYISDGVFLNGNDYVHASESNEADIILNGTMQFSGNFTNNSENPVFASIENEPNGLVVLNGMENNQIAGTKFVNFENLSLQNQTKLLYVDNCKIYGTLSLDTYLELNTYTLYIENPSNNAIVLLSGGIISETLPDEGLGTLIRKTNSSADEYQIPFATGDNGADLTVKIATQAEENFREGYLVFATYPTTTDNNPLPNELSSTADIKVENTADRFWRIENQNAVSSNVNISFSYTQTDIYNLESSKLSPMRYNSDTDSWTDFSPETNNESSNSIVAKNIPENELYPWWTLYQIPDELNIPNGITPDGDGLNDTWKIENCENCEVYIYNRWGSLIYESNNYDNSWNGDSHPAGAYYYVIEQKGKEPINGNLNIIR